MVNYSALCRSIKHDYMNILTWAILKKTKILNGCETFAFKYIKLAQNTKQFRRLVLENFITVINFLFGRKGFLWAKALGFWAAEHLSPPCASKPLPYNM